mgnify:CR=1 FL=1
MQNTPIAETSTGFSFEGALDSALNAWASVEAIKAQKAASGQDQTQARLEPELENAATRVVAQQVAPTPAPSNNIVIAGVALNKNILIATGSVLITLFVAKKLL